MSRPPNEMVGGFSPWLITGSELNRASLSRFSGSSSACTAATNTLAAASDWRSANVWWNSTAAAFGLSSLHPEKDPHSASPFPPEREPGGQANAGRAAAAPRLVLLVEDNPTDVYVIKELIARSKQNLQVHVVRNGHDASLYLQGVEADENAACPALVLLDLNLPKLTGVEVLKQMRTSTRCRHIPVIITTSSTAATDRSATQKLGAQAYFQKPTDLTAYLELGRIIESLLPPENGPKS